MKKGKIIRLKRLITFLVVMMIVISCGVTKGYKAVKQKDDGILCVLNPLIKRNYTSVLYKAGIHVYGKYFSGLFFFKNMPDSSVHVVMLSEFGLNMIDMKYKDGDIEVKHVQEFLNRPIVTDMLKNDVRILIEEIQRPSNYKTYLSKSGGGQAIRLKRSSINYYYFCDQNYRVSGMVLKKNMFSKTKLLVDEYKNDVPAKFTIKHMGNKVRLNFNLLKITP